VRAEAVNCSLPPNLALPAPRLNTAGSRIVRRTLLHTLRALYSLGTGHGAQHSLPVTIKTVSTSIGGSTTPEARSGVAPWAARFSGWPPELYLLGGGLLLCISIVMRGRSLGIDRFTLPKEFVIALTAFGAGIVGAMRARIVRIDRIDLCLTGFLIWTIIATFGALNSWWALRGLFLLIAGIAVFWISRSLRDRGYGSQLIAVLALALIPVALPALLQAYGVMRDISLENRSPGGTLGNRNSMAQLLMLGLPPFLLYAVRVRRQAHTVMVNVVLAGIAAALLLSRTRTAWLAAIVLIGTLVLSVWMAPSSVRALFPARRGAVLAGSAVIGALAASLLPNRLVWNSSQPYIDTVRGIVDYRSGSGRGRLVQYSNTLKMIRDHPLVGVGPGNWPVHYPEYASPGDPNFSSDIMMNRLNNGDWLGFAAELGLPGLLLLTLAGYGFLRLAWSRYRDSLAVEPDLEALALLAMLPVAAVLGTFDSKLHTPAGMFFLFAGLGALAPRDIRIPPVGLKDPAQSLWTALVTAVLFPAVLLTGRQLWSAQLTLSGTPATLMRAAQIYPGNYRAHMLLARTMAGRDRCQLAFLHLASARSLYPAAPDPDWLSAKCHARAVSRRY
jgi:O-antigen ligase